MDIFVIQGGKPLEGTVRTAGAKNSVLPILAAALLTEETLSLENVPDLSDVRTMLRILEMLGAEVEHTGPNRLDIRSRPSAQPVAPWELVRKMRASFEVFGPLLGRRGRAEVSYPGGCSIGVRPVDAHIRGFEALGAKIRTQEGYVVAEAPPEGLPGGEAYLATSSGSSVGATRNVMMAAVLARGRSVLTCAACEPEVVDLADCLNAMGAKVHGAGSPTIEIQGVEALHGAKHSVIPDRIEAGTYVVAGAITGGRVRVEGCRPEHLTALLDALYRSGVGIERGRDWIETQPRDIHKERLRPTDITTQPYPGFPTDLQAQWMVLMTLADGVSVITERIFPDRYMHLAELLRLGARIRRQETAAVVEGVASLSGASIMASDLRASAALVLAGLVSKGQTQVHRVYHIDRGYERIEERLENMGGSIRRESVAVEGQSAPG
ncbi:MAG: UDP-N-acetylglucosamine 1-carboxyvinyltransferase [Planctomycetes bacterium]|nr:UDP-N-acetylglucosamine 1-carboxyvinyltransferase [Planctomycetota bacterium]